MNQSINFLKTLMPSMALRAQKIYDEWDQDSDGYDEEFGEGGICHEIADAIVDVLTQNNIEATSVSQAIGEVHVYVIAKFKEGIYEIDIPPSTYETGYAYTWKKIKNVKFQASDIAVNLIDRNPENFENYIEHTQTFKKWLGGSLIRRIWPI